jgi:thiol-disulfide isomerase/thioredoxin
MKFLFFFFFIIFLPLNQVEAKTPIVHDLKALAKIKLSAESLITTSGYVHSWEPFPTIDATDLSDHPISIPSYEGYVSVVYFLASWCIPCQELIPKLKDIENQYKNYDMDFYYIFSHDTKEEVVQMLKNTQLQGTILFSTFDLLKNFHNPPLPSVYIGDRIGWLNYRIEKWDVTQIDKLKTKLDLFTIFE